MRIAVISDTHGNVEGARLVLMTFPDIDLVIHLGDHAADIDALAADLPCPVVGVLGNEDRARDGPTELVIPAESIRLFLTHGHRFDLNPYLPKEKWEGRLDMIVAEAKKEWARAALFGHTHKAFLGERDGVLLVNPGDFYPGGEHMSIAILTVHDRSISAEVFRFDRKFNRSLLFSYPG
jgi:hypothetical protein